MVVGQIDAPPAGSPGLPAGSLGPPCRVPGILGAKERMNFVFGHFFVTFLEFLDNRRSLFSWVFLNTTYLARTFLLSLI